MALSAPPTVNTLNFRSLFASWISDLTDEVNNKAEESHTHGAGGVVVSIVAAEANLGTGSTDGEKKICSSNANCYTWDDGNSKWRVCDGNKYATASLPTTAYTIPTGTLVYDTTTDTIKIWDGDSWESALDVSGYQPADDDLTALAALSSTGIMARTAADTYTMRTITGTANEIAVADGNGVSDNPTLSLPSSLDISGKTVTFPNISSGNLVHSWSLGSDHTYRGEIVTATAGETLVFGELCYFKSDGKFWKTDSDAVATTKGLLAIAVEGISADASGLFLIRGMIRDDSWSFTAADELWVDTTAGDLTATQPSGSGDVVRLAGYAKSSTHVWFDPSKSYIEIT